MVRDRHARTVFAKVAAVGAVAVAAAVAVSATSGGSLDAGSSERIARQREHQAQRAAAEAGLGPDVQSLLGLAARAPAATFSATYSSGPDRVVVRQLPPRRRVDVVVDGRVLEALVTDGADGGDDLRCTRPAGGDWTCDHAPERGGLGAFSPELVARTVEALQASLGDFDLDVRTTTIAGTRARCLRSTPHERGAPAELCVSRQGVPLFLDRGDGSAILRAIAYRPSATPKDVRRPDR